MKKKITRILALIVALALVVMMIISAAISSANGEGIARNKYSFDIVLLEDEQALRITQRLDYYNDTGEYLDRVIFAVYANMFRRESTIMYEDASSALPFGYTPGGVEFFSVKAGGEEADWGIEGEGEYFMRVACDLDSGEVCTFEFIYDVLLTRNAAFCGMSSMDWRLSGFYPIACMYINGEWKTNSPVQHSRYTYAPSADYSAVITLPDTYTVACTGESERIDNGDGSATWTLSALNIHEFAISAGRAWREYAGKTESGIQVSVFSNSRLGAPRALECAIEAIEIYERWFGEYPYRIVTIVQSDYCLERIAFPGLIWINGELFTKSRRADLEYELRFALAEQYFGLSVYADPLADSWLCESVCEYITYLVCEETDGYEAFVNMLKSRLIDSVSVTMPGNLNITSSGSVFNQSQYDVVVRDRGALVMHELRLMLERERLLTALKTYYADCRDAETVTEMDFLSAVNTSTGKDWEDFLTEILFNIDEYSIRNTEWFE